MEQPAQQAHPDIPTERAWKEGRRLYVTCGYKSVLNGQLRALGAKWDAERKALWLGSGKAGQAVPLVLASMERAAEAEQVKSAGHWASIPYGAVAARERAKQLGARWDGQRKIWALPNMKALAEVEGLVGEWLDAQRQARQAEQGARRRTPEQVVADAGRAATGEQVQAGGRLDGYMRRPEAERLAPQVGEVRRVKGGTRCVVVSRRVDFVSEDLAADFGGEPGWHWEYTGLVVEPTEQELADDRRHEAERADATALAELMAAAARTADLHEVVELAQVGGPSVTRRHTGAHADSGRLVLDGDGALWQHPGVYDDWRRTEGRVTDPAVIEQARTLLAAGTRTVRHQGDDYEVCA